MEFEEVALKVSSIVKGNSKKKTGSLRIFCDKQWRVSIRFINQVQDHYSWLVKDIKRISGGKQAVGTFILNFVNGDSINLYEIQQTRFKEFRDLYEDILHNRKPPVRPVSNSADAENQSQQAPGKAHVLTSPGPGAAQRVPLSPRQVQGSKSQSHSSNPVLNSSTTSTMRPNTNVFFNRSQAKSEQKLNSRNFYGKNLGSSQTFDRAYGSFSVGSIKRLKRPGLMPDPEKAKRYRIDVNYDWGKKPTTPTKALQGFSNLGNTCYMNATLQALYHLPTFADDVQSAFRNFGHLKRKWPENVLCRALGTLFFGLKKEVCSEKRNRYLTGVKNAISASARRFCGYEQHDAHEFLSQLLDQLKEEIIKFNKVKEQIPEEEVHEKERVCLTPEAPLRTDEDEQGSPSQQIDNPTIKNFEFTVLHSINCQVCGANVEKEETFHDLSVDIPRRSMCGQERTIQHALDLFFEDEEIEYKCEKCGGMNSHVKHTFTRLPRILIVHLKRYSILQQGMICGKSGGSTTIPRYITLQEHCNEMTSPPFPPDINQSFENDTSFKSQSSMSQDDDISSRRKLDFDRQEKFPTSFKHVSASVRLQAQGYPMYGSSSAAIHEDKLDPDDEIQLLTDEQYPEDPLPDLSKHYQQQRPILAQVDGTMDFDDTADSSQTSLDEERVNLLTTEQQMELAKRRSMKECTNKPSTTSSREEEDEELQRVLEQSRLECGPGQQHRGQQQEPKSDFEELSDLKLLSTDVQDLADEAEPMHRKTSTASDPKSLDTVDSELATDDKSSHGNKRSKDIIDEIEGEWFSVDKNKINEHQQRKSYCVKRRKISQSKQLRRQRSRSPPVLHSTPIADNAAQHSEKYTAASSSEELPSLARHLFSGGDAGESELPEGIKQEFNEDIFDDSNTTADDGIREAVERLHGVNNDSVTDPTKDRPKLLITEEDEDGSFNRGHTTSCTPDRDNNKENVTPPEPDDLRSNSPDWLKKREEDKEKEDRELQQALEMSLRDQGGVMQSDRDRESEREREDLERATQLSLADYNKNVMDCLGSDEDVSDCQSSRQLYKDEEKLKLLMNNTRTGELPFSYRLISVVSHLGASSTVGHYICDAYDIRKDQWQSYNDSHVSKMSEIDVCKSRQQSGYVFFYCAKDVMDELAEFYQNGLDKAL